MNLRKVRTTLRLAGGMVLALLGISSGTVSGQSPGGAFRLVGQVVGGGGASQGGAYVLRGSILTPSGGRSASTVQPGVPGEDFRLVGGAVLPMVGPVVQAPRIQAVLTPDKLAELTWDVDIDGFVLEFSSTTGPGADWQPVVPQPTGRTFTTPCQQPARFFRLRER